MERSGSQRENVEINEERQKEGEKEENKRVREWERQER